MRAIFQIIANGDDITRVIQDRVLRIHTVDKPGLDADECELELDDRDGKIEFPPKGATLKVSLGWGGQGLAFLGEYAIDEVSLKGPPASVLIRGRPANMRATAKTHRYGSWENAKLADIVGDVARRNQWTPVCAIDVLVPRADQFGESDLHFITRLSRQHGATATVKAGKLIVAGRGAGKSASGLPLPSITVALRITSRLTRFPENDAGLVCATAREHVRHDTTSRAAIWRNSFIRDRDKKQWKVSTKPAGKATRSYFGHWVILEYS